MNAHVGRLLTLRLSRALATGEAFDVGIAYGVDPDELAQLAEYWLTDFDLERQLAWLTELYELLPFGLPESPLEALALALTLYELHDSIEQPARLRAHSGRFSA